MRSKVPGITRALGQTERLLRQFERVESGCWLWVGGIDRNGRGRLSWNGRVSYLAHRAAYEHFVGPIPDGLVIDHTCHNRDLGCAGGVGCVHRRCVNPDHLEPVTHQTNVLRGRGLAASNARQLECVHGHPFTPENTYICPNGKRSCRQCDRAASVAYRLRRKTRLASRQETAA